MTAATDDTGHEDDEAIVCRCYTKARRHPKVIGTINRHNAAPSQFFRFPL